MSERDQPVEPGDPAGGTQRRIGVYICHCGGNISDYVDVAQVVERVQDEPGVVCARRAMFTCSDATQQEIIADIQQQRLDGLVVASCSPKLHTETFRDVARRAGLNPYQYTQVNLREQCSWAHTDDPAGATDKAIRLVRAGIARTVLTTALEPLSVETQPAALVIGGGVTGLRAALAFADLGLAVYLVEREDQPGGHVGQHGPMFPNQRDGRELIAELIRRVSANPAVTVFTGARVVGRSGGFGDYQVTIEVGSGEHIEVRVGTILVATGFSTYQPAAGEFGYGGERVLTLPDFQRLLDDPQNQTGALSFQGQPVGSIAYLYCVGARQGAEVVDGNRYCSRFCCTAAVHTSLRVSQRDPSVRQYHCYRDMRSYGSFETLFDASRRAGSLYLKVPDDQPPQVTQGDHGQPTVIVQDVLAAGQTVALPVDLVVLVTAGVPRDNSELIRLLKIPVGRDGFLNEIHPKLRPVETVVDGVTIAGACQGPKTSAESVASGMAAVAQSSAVLRRGHADLDPLVAEVLQGNCDGCGQCLSTCPYDAIRRDGELAVIDAATCKGCGGCVPVCPRDAIDLRGYTDAQVRAQISAMSHSMVEVGR